MNLSAGCDHEQGVFSNFYISIGLTQKGLKETNQVLAAVFKYAQRLVEAGPQNFVFDECRSIGTIRFDYADKGSAIDYCVKMTKYMQHFSTLEDIPQIIRHRYIADVFDKERVQQMAAEIANPANTLVFFASKSFDDSELPLKEKWYKIDYSSQKFSDEMISSLKQPVIN